MHWALLYDSTSLQNWWLNTEGLVPRSFRNSDWAARSLEPFYNARPSAVESSTDRRKDLGGCISLKRPSTTSHFPRPHPNHYHWHISILELSLPITCLKTFSLLKNLDVQYPISLIHFRRQLFFSGHKPHSIRAQCLYHSLCILQVHASFPCCHFPNLLAGQFMYHFEPRTPSVLLYNYQSTLWLNAEL
jgi:hypothetical protein